MNEALALCFELIVTSSVGVEVARMEVSAQNTLAIHEALHSAFRNVREVYDEDAYWIVVTQGKEFQVYQP